MTATTVTPILSGEPNPNEFLVSLIVRDEPRVLTRIASLIGRRGYNIKSLSVGNTEVPGVSRMTLVVQGDRALVENAMRQLEKLQDVIRVVDHALEKFVDRELALVKVRVAGAEQRVEVRHMAEDFRARIVDVGRHALTFEVTGDQGKITAFIEQMRPFGIIESMRTGRIALTRGSNADIPSHVYTESPTLALEPVHEPAM